MRTIFVFVEHDVIYNPLKSVCIVFKGSFTIIDIYESVHSVR